MLLGHEQRYHPSCSKAERAYIAIFGMPIVGLRIRARNIFSLIPGDRDFRAILDAGTGPGVFAFALGRRFPNSRVVGIDFSEESVHACRHIAARIGAENVSFRQGSVEHMTDLDSFDLIVCVDLMEHIENDVEAISRLYRATVPGGMLLLHVPAVYRRYPLWKRQLNFEVEGHVRVGYEPEHILRKIAQAGYIVAESGFTYGFWETLANNMSYFITRARRQNKTAYAFLFPFLYLLSWLGPRARPKDLGAGIYVVARKDGATNCAPEEMNRER
jgi:SAM-dependent methyltransferase